MNFLIDFLKGIIIGIGAVAPGVSGGTIAVILGVYSRLTRAIANIFHNFFKKVKTLFPLGLGIIFGVLAFSRVMKYLFYHHEINVKFIFIGLMLGTIPSVLSDANKKGFKRAYLIPSIIAFGITIAFTILENNTISIIPTISPDFMTLVFYGLIVGFGTIIPGVSSSIILMYIGAYETLLDVLISFNIGMIIPLGIGFVLSVILFAKIINYLFRKAYGFTYYTVLGFVLGSMVAIIPNVGIGYELVFGLIYSIIGFLFSFTFMNKLST